MVIYEISQADLMLFLKYQAALLVLPYVLSLLLRALSKLLDVYLLRRESALARKEVVSR